MEWLNKVLQVGFLTGQEHKDKITAKSLELNPAITETVLSDEYCSLDIQDYEGWKCVQIDKNFGLYKGRFKPHKLLNDPRNPYGDKPAWFGPKPVANSYNVGHDRNWVTYEIHPLIPLKLLVLTDTTNLHKIFMKLVQNARKNEEYKQLLLHFSLGCGYGMTMEEQLEIYQTLEKEFTPVLHSQPNRLKIGMGNGYISNLVTDIHRVSIRTSIDTGMLNAICKITGLDGYIMPNLPTFIFNKEFTKSWNYLSEEIAICKQAKSVEITVAGNIPNYLGLQGAIFIKGSRIFKYFFNTDVVKRVITREYKVHKLVKKSKCLVPLDYFKFDPKYGMTMSSRKSWDTDLSNFLLSPNITKTQLITIFNQIKEGCSELAHLGIIQNDMKLENILVDIHPLKIGISDFGSALFDKPEYIKLERDWKRFCFDYWVRCLYLKDNNVFQEFREEYLEPIMKGIDEKIRHKILELPTLYEIKEYIRINKFVSYITWGIGI